MTTKYYQRKKCECKDFYDNECVMCLNTKFIRGADITELMEAIKLVTKNKVMNWDNLLADLIEVVETE